MQSENLVDYLKVVTSQDSVGGIAVYADTEVAYGKVVEVLNIGAQNSMKMVLATKPIDSKRPDAQTIANE